MRTDEDSYDLYVRGQQLLGDGHAAAAAVVLSRLTDREPDSRAARELLARALFDAGRHREACEEFALLLDLAPDDDYAHFGRGSALWRLQQFREAEEELAMAAVMRPERRDYARALQQVRATLRARQEAGLPSDGPIGSAGAGEMGANDGLGERSGPLGSNDGTP